MELGCPETSQDCKPPIDPTKVIKDLFWLSTQCELRCMFECAQWAQEQLNHLPESHFSASNLSEEFKQEDPYEGIPTRKRILIMFTRTLITNKDYNRAKFFLKNEKNNSSLEAFLYYFSWYMVSIRNRLENEADDLDKKEEFNDTEIAELRDEMESLKIGSPHLFDCFLNYLLGLIRKNCAATDLSIQVLTEAVQQEQRCWPAWETLASLVDGFYAVKIEQQEFANTWFYNLFVAETMFRLQLYMHSIGEYTCVSRYIGASPYILCQIAAAQSELKEHDSAIISFQKIRKKDPYRIDQMHFYSDSLYIRQNMVELSVLAKWFYESHKFHWETCCIVANYYSAKNIHDQAQEFLKRAIRLCPTNASIWVLLGHEYLETKNHEAAMASYKKATAIDPKCYRGWYGLGQLHEIRATTDKAQQKNALFFYQKAHKCRPDDSRMLIALGVIFSKLDRKSDAEKCFKKAFQIGDVEGNALTSLAKLYEEQNDNRNAAKAYEAYLTLYTEELVGDLDLIATACRFLARYNLELGNLDDSYSYAQRCLNFDLSKEDGYRILQLVKSKRREDQERVFKSHEATPSQQRNVSFRTPADAQRPIGGGDDSTLQTPIPQTSRKEVNLAAETDEDMNTNSDDDDLEISF